MQSERCGVRMGQRVRDLDGTSLGRVTGLYDWGFATRRGPPILFGRDFVVRYEEVRGVRDGAIVVARTSRDLEELAAGELPASWRIPVPHRFPSAATPAEARELMEEVAAGRVPGGVPDDGEERRRARRRQEEREGGGRAGGRGTRSRHPTRSV